MRDDALWDTYAGALISCAVNGRTVRLRGPSIDPLPADAPIFVLTAWNPGAVDRDRAANDLAEAVLEAELTGNRLTWWPADGRSPDDSWSEPGVAIAGLDRARACALGERYGQLAVYELTADEVLVVRSSDRAVVRTRARVQESPCTVARRAPRRASTAIQFTAWTETCPLPSAVVDVDRQVELLTAGAIDVIPEAELRTKLASGRSLRIKLGIDPTASDLHLGFAVVLRRLRLFQDLGHVAVLILGDFTAMVGDPSGKSVTRPRLAKDEVDAHAQTFIEQATHILDPAPERLEIVRNSTWLASMDMEGVLGMTSQVTVARMLERDDFANRYKRGVAISLMEFLYPLLQATDSVEIRADVELGGTDQLFNLLMGRHLQARAGQEQQVVITNPLLVGLDGEQKMSKSLGNYVGIAEAPRDQFGKLMSISDELMPTYFQYATGWPPERVAEVTAQLTSGELHPNTAKRLLASTVVDLYHGAGAGEAAEADFDRMFKAGAAPDEIAEASVERPGPWKLAKVLVAAGLASSGREAGRLINDGAVKLDGEAVREDRDLSEAEVDGRVVQVGKRHFARIRVV